MPNAVVNNAPFLGGSGNPDTYTELSTPSNTGDLGTTFTINNRTYTKVQTPAGVTIAANQLAFWVDRFNNIVTNVGTNGNLGGVATSFRNNVAGVFRAAVPPLSNCCILVRGYNIPVKEAGAATAGMILTANTGTNSDALGVAIGTAPPTQAIGVATGPTAGGNCPTNVSIG